MLENGAEDEGLDLDSEVVDLLKQWAARARSDMMIKGLISQFGKHSYLFSWQVRLEDQYQSVVYMVIMKP